MLNWKNNGNGVSRFTAPSPQPPRPLKVTADFEMLLVKIFSLKQKTNQLLSATKGKKIKAVNYYHKVLHLGCCSSPRSASVFRDIGFL